jgi:NTE family protein
MATTGKTRKAPPRQRAGGKTPTAFVFAGGGSLGAVQVGMLKALMAAKLMPDLVVGASVGAINGAFFAGRPGVAGVAALGKIWLRIRQDDVFPVTAIGGVKALLGARNYLVDPGNLSKLISGSLPYARFEQAKLPCYVVATDIYNGHDVVFSEGDARKAVLASASIPAVFPPVQYDERYLVDGGVANNTPISTAVALGAKRLIVLPTGFSCSISEPPRTLVAMALHALNLMIMEQLVRDIGVYSKNATIVVVPPLCPVDVTPYDFSQTRSLIERAHRATVKWLAGGGLGCEDIPHTMVPHHEDDDPDVPYIVPAKQKAARRNKPRRRASAAAN